MTPIRNLPLFRESEDAALSEDAGPFRADQSSRGGAPVSTEIDIASEFLLTTLVRKESIREVGKISFMTARAWRASVKDIQIKSLRILKKALPPNFVEAAGRDVADVARKIHGDHAFNLVVPVPCGHSGRPDCLSVRMAEVVAREIHAGFLNVLEGRLTKGSSHPRQSQNFILPRLKAVVRGKVLVIDDVCTTGRHISMSIAALREAGADAFGLAWIGAR